MKRFSRLISFFILGVFSFFVFLYFTFPYEVLKEAVVLRVSAATGYSLNMKELTPVLPLGMNAQEVKVTTPGGQSLQITQLKVKLNVFKLFLGKLALSGEFIDDKNGTLACEAQFSLLKLILRQGMLPSSIYLMADKFLLGPFVDFALASQAQDPSVNVMLKPWLESVDIQGKLNAFIDLSIDERDLSRSEGEATINLQEMTIKSLNSNLAVPDQRFTKALFKTNLKNGTLTILKDSAFISQDLSVNFSGTIKQKPDLLKSLLDVDIGIDMGAPIKEQFDILIYAITNKETNGKLQIKINGALSPFPNISFL